MKKLFSLLLILALLLCLGITAAAESADKTVDITYRDIRIVVNGTEIVPCNVNGERVEPFLLNGSTYLPLRAVAGALGLSVDWDNASSTVILSTGAEPFYGSESPTLSLMETRQVTITYRDIKLIVDGVPLTPTDVAGNPVEPFLLGGSTYLPLRAVADALGLTVGWDSTTSTVTLDGHFGGTMEYLLSRSTSEVSFSADGLAVSAASEDVYTYDERGNMLSCTMTSPGYSATASYTYDQQDNMLTYRLETSDGSSDAAAWYVYDANGNCLRQELQTGEDTVVTLCTYDDEGNILSREENDAFVSTRTENSYKNGRLTESVSLLDGAIISTSTYRYDSRGNRLSETVTFPDGQRRVTTYTYNDADQLLTVTCQDGEESYTHSYRYTDQGWLASERYTSGDYESRYFYSYDQRGNCVRTAHDDSEGGNYEFLYTYSAADRLVTMTYTDSADPSANYSEAFAYSQRGDLIRDEITYANGETLLNTYDYTYNSAGKLLRYETVLNGLRSVFTYEYIAITKT